MEASTFSACNDVGEKCNDCSWGLVSVYLKTNKGATVRNVVDYVNNNQRWLGKYLGPNDK